MHPRSKLQLLAIETRLATGEDVDELACLYARHFADARIENAVYDAAKQRASLQEAIEDQIAPHIIAVKDGRIIGFISYVLNELFTKQPIAALGELYVVPEWRRSAVGRMLVATATHLAKTDGAFAFQATVTSAVPETRSLKNLFTKAGFQEVGYVVRRSL